MSELHVLLSSALLLGVIHTALGIDHSLTFVVLGKSRGWSQGRTLAVTGLCGLLHVASSVLIASLGLGFGVAVGHLVEIEESRAALGAWLLVAFGFAYTVVALLKARVKEFHPDASAEAHALPTRHLMPTLLVMFGLGPCEALLPLLTTSGVRLDVLGAGLVAIVFSVATIVTMLVLVYVGHRGSTFLAERSLWPRRLERHVHVLAGLTLTLSGVTIRVLGI